MHKSSLSLPEELLDILVCPATQLKLELADEALLKVLAQRAVDSQLITVNGDLIVKAPTSALIRTDKKLCYLIQDGIPMLLVGQGISI